MRSEGKKRKNGTKKKKEGPPAPFPPIVIMSRVTHIHIHIYFVIRWSGVLRSSGMRSIILRSKKSHFDLYFLTILML